MVPRRITDSEAEAVASLYKEWKEMEWGSEKFIMGFAMTFALSAVAFTGLGGLVLVMMQMMGKV